jgi:S-adenosylmethionine hydrolase
LHELLPLMKGFIIALIILFSFDCTAQKNALVFQTDFGLKDGAVAAMKGVAYSVDPDLRMFDLTHEIPAYNIWEAAYRLDQAAAYWPAGSVFVSVVDPGVGSARRSIVMKSKSGHYFVTPDNGTLTLVAESLGIAEVRVIDERKNRLANSDSSYTFHGRDVYAYTGARLAAAVINFDDVGQISQDAVIRLPFQRAGVSDKTAHGTVDIIDVQYGNIWTNIDRETFRKLNLRAGDKVLVRIYDEKKLKYDGEMIFGKTFADVPEGQPVAYLNSLLKFSIAINMGSFAAVHNIESGPGWTITVSKK